MKVRCATVNTAGLTEQIKAVAEVLARSGRSLALDEVAAHFSGRGRWRDRPPTLLDTLVALGRLHRGADGRWTDMGRETNTSVM